jgi:hypothetical protein
MWRSSTPRREYKYKWEVNQKVRVQGRGATSWHSRPGVSQILVPTAQVGIWA